MHYETMVLAHRQVLATPGGSAGTRDDLYYCWQCGEGEVGFSGQLLCLTSRLTWSPEQLTTITVNIVVMVWCNYCRLFFESIPSGFSLPVPDEVMPLRYTWLLWMVSHHQGDIRCASGRCVRHTTFPIVQVQKIAPARRNMSQSVRWIVHTTQEK